MSFFVIARRMFVTASARTPRLKYWSSSPFPGSFESSSDDTELTEHRFDLLSCFGNLSALSGFGSDNAILSNFFSASPFFAILASCSWNRRDASRSAELDSCPYA